MELGYQIGEGGGEKHSGVIFINIWEEADMGVSCRGNNMCKAVVSPKEGLAALPLTRRSLCRGVLAPPVIRHISRVSLWGHFQALFPGPSPGALSPPLLSQDALSGQQHPQWGGRGGVESCSLAGIFKELRAFVFGAEPWEVPLMTDLRALV